MARITGRISVSVGGIGELFNKEGAVASGIGLSGKPNMELEAVFGDTGLHGFIEKPVLAMCEVTVSDTDGLMLDDLAKIRENGTIIFSAAGGGKVYTMNGATCLRNFTLTGGQGEVPIRFVGSYWIETVSES